MVILAENFEDMCQYGRNYKDTLALAQTRETEEGHETAKGPTQGN